MPSPSVKKILNLPLRWLGAGVAVVVLGVSALFHGLAPVPIRHDPDPTPGTVIHGGPWDVTVIGGRILASQDGLRTLNDGARWFGVVATVDVTADDSRSDIDEILRLRHVAGLLSPGPTRTILLRDARDVAYLGPDVRYLNPGMPEQIEFLWEQESSAPVSTSVDIDVYSKTLRVNSLTGELEWLNGDVLTTVHATVLDKRA